MSDIPDWLKRARTDECPISEPDCRDAWLDGFDKAAKLLLDKSNWYEDLTNLNKKYILVTDELRKIKDQKE